MLGCAAILTACAVGSPDGPGPKVEVWRAVQGKPSAVWRGATTQLYTYVLVGEIGDGTADASSAAAKAGLTALLASVQTGIPLQTGSSVSDQTLAMANQYLIPGRGDPVKQGRVTWDSYDRSLSQEYLGAFRAIVGGRPELRNALARKGPFLVASKEPSAKYLENPSLLDDRRAGILIMDLSGADGRVIGEYVQAFRGAVRNDITTSREISELLPQLANLLATIDSAIPVIAEAYGNTLKMWTKATGLQVKGSSASSQQVGAR